MSFKVWALAFVCVIAAVSGDNRYQQPQEYYPDVVPVYRYDYQVKDDYTYNNFGASESKNGDETQGSYYVLLPDGRIQTVTYTVSGNDGFVADVSYTDAGNGYTPKPQQYTQLPAQSHYVPTYSYQSPTPRNYNNPQPKVQLIEVPRVNAIHHQAEPILYRHLAAGNNYRTAPRTTTTEAPATNTVTEQITEQVSTAAVTNVEVVVTETSSSAEVSSEETSAEAVATTEEATTVAPTTKAPRYSRPVQQQYTPSYTRPAPVQYTSSYYTRPSYAVQQRPYSKPVTYNRGYNSYNNGYTSNYNSGYNQRNSYTPQRPRVYKVVVPVVEESHQTPAEEIKETVVTESSSEASEITESTSAASTESEPKSSETSSSSSEEEELKLDLDVSPSEIVHSFESKKL